MRIKSEILLSLKGAIILALIVMSGYYLISIREIRASMERTFSERVDLVSTYISMMQQQVDGMARTFESNYGRMRGSVSPGARFYREYGVWGLPGDVSGNGQEGTFTGTGKFPLPVEVRKEMASVRSLDPQIRAIFEYNKNVTWIYYTSAHEFIYLAPAHKINEYRFSPSDYERPFWNQAAPGNNPELKQIITDLYDDSAGKGLMISISSPVRVNRKFTGVMSLDLGVELLKKLVLAGDLPGETILTDEKGKIVVRRGVFSIDEIYPLVDLQEGWRSSDDGYYWMRSEIGGGELNLLHRIKKRDFYIAAARRSLFVWSLSGVFVLFFFMVSRDIEARRREGVAQRQIRDALLESETRLKAFMDNVPSLIVIKDHELRIVFSNNAFRGFFPSDDWIGKKPRDVFPENMAQIVEESDRKALNEGSTFFEETFSDRNGENRNFFTQKFRIDRPGKDPMIGVIVSDITERVKMAEMLKEKEATLSTLISNLPGFVYRCAADRNWTMSFISEGCEKITGYSPDDFIDNKTLAFNDIIYPEYSEHIWELWQIILEERRAFEYEYPITTRSGETRWIWERGSGIYSENGEVLFLEGFITDITERKRAEEALVIFRETVENSTDAIGMATPEGRHYYQNRAFTELFGDIGENPPESVYVDRETGEAVFRTIQSGGVWIGEVQMLSKEGAVLDIFLRGYANIDNNGNIVTLVGIHTDITEQKRTIAERERLKEQLAQSQKMESVGRLAGGVAHDFNNMLGVIIGQAELALMKCEKSSPVYQRLNEIEKAARRSADVTSRLLAFARKQTVAPRVVDLNNAIAGIITMLRRLIGEDIELEWIPGKDLWPLRIDPSQIDQILTNLTVNARDAITGAGKICIETSNIIADKVRCSALTESVPGDYVMLTVSDTGSGFSKDLYDHIFEPFFTTKDAGKGTGLGLAMVYGIVRQNKGHITVESEPGKGSTFRVCFPRSDEAEPEEEKADFNFIPAGANETILLVEDEPMLLEMSRTMLEELGYPVIAVSSSEEAIRMAENHDDSIKILFTDVIMPGMNGRELAEKLQGLFPEMKTIYMSGYTADIIAHHGVLEEGVNFIQKPFNIAKLAESIIKALS